MSTDDPRMCSGLGQLTEIPFSGLTRRNLSRTSLAGITTLSVTTRIRASAGTRFNAMLQPPHPALRAGGERRALDDGGGGAHALPFELIPKPALGA